MNSAVQECSTCQHYKLTGPGYGQLHPREASLAPWDEVAVDLIGPWKIIITHRLVFNYCHEGFKVARTDAVRFVLR